MESSLDKIEVNAKQTELSPFDFIGSHQSIDLGSYSHNFTELASILNQQAGIHTQSYSGVGQYSTPMIRGAEGQQVLVFVNGIPLNSLNGSSANISTISLIDIDKINIYRGFVPMELSATAIGGAIDLVSEEVNESTGFAKYSLGTYGVNQAQLLQNFSESRFQTGVYFDWLSAENDFIYQEQQPISSPSTPKYEPRYNNSVKRKLLGFTSLYDINHYHSVKLLTSFGEEIKGLSGKINSPSNQTNLQNNQAQFTITHNFKNITYSYSYNHNKELYDDRSGNIGLGQQYNQYETDFQKLNIKYQKNFRGLELYLNQQFQQENLNISYLNNPSSSKPDCINHGECDSEIERLQSSTGIRTQWQASKDIYTNLQLVSLTNIDHSLKEDVDQSSNFISLFTGISYLIYGNLALNSHYSQQIRPPSTNELFGDRGNTIGNINLRAEKSKSFEIGFDYSSSTYSMNSYIFLREVEDNISAEQDSRGVIKYSNISKTQYRGIEVSLDKNFNQNIFYRSNIAIQSSIIADDNLQSIIKNQISNQREITSSHSLGYQTNSWLTQFDYLYEAGGYYTNLNDLPISKKHQFDFMISKNWNDTFLSFKAINITNQRIRDYPNSPVSGLTLYLTLKQSWGI